MDFFGDCDYDTIGVVYDYFFKRDIWYGMYNIQKEECVYKFNTERSLFIALTEVALTPEEFNNMVFAPILDEYFCVFELDFLQSVNAREVRDYYIKLMGW